MPTPVEPAPKSIATSIRDAMLGVERRLGFSRAKDDAPDADFGPVDELIEALGRRRRPAGFDMGSTVVITGAFVEPRVWVRADGRTWSLTTTEAAVAAIRFRLEGFRAAGPLADAFARAVRDAEARMDRINGLAPAHIAPSAAEAAQ